MADLVRKLLAAPDDDDFVRAGLAASNGEVRRAIANNAIMVNDARVTSEKATIGEADVTVDGVVKLSLGRKRHVVLKPT